MFVYSYFIWLTSNAFAWAPEVNCVWLPGCDSNSLTNPISIDENNDIWIEVISSIIWETIQFVAVIAVIALIISWMMYLVSWGEEEKTKKAKTWIIWSLVWVVLSISAWWIINILNQIIIYNS